MAAPTHQLMEEAIQHINNWNDWYQYLLAEYQSCVYIARFIKGSQDLWVSLYTHVSKV